MDRRKFIQNTSLSLLALSLTKPGFSSFADRKSQGSKIPVGAHVWVYAASQPGIMMYHQYLARYFRIWHMPVSMVLKRWSNLCVVLFIQNR